MKIQFQSDDGLVPAIVQDADTRQVLMFAYMNAESLARTMATGLVTFYSRSRQALWVKGETSGNSLRLVDIKPDCDQDALLVIARPSGPVCHTGATACFGEDESLGFLYKLEAIVAQRVLDDNSASYTCQLFKSGKKRIAQKVAEEAIELALETQSGADELFMAEAADLLYHFLVLLRARSLALSDIEQVLFDRNTAGMQK